MKLNESRGGDETEKHRQQQHFEHDLKNMISSLTHMGGGGGDKAHAGTSQYEEEEDSIRVITLSGSNLGATMKTELDNNHADGHKNGDQELDFFSTYVNSNFQAVNNSIMIGAKYETHDPGVHLDISGDVEKPSMKVPSKSSRGKKGKNPSRSDRRESEHTN
ncbi:PREDICTED: uncharacterized protein LOC104703959 [Camelina sativa]|uniref:Uncharacterized protein LOC104703959 n=1 Tax=Camelina sativa TaxID=90675 RepID=A0ABM0SZF1_CAMSA|nr:PREDICTED: uncharacterized protein LOC104703959 [Camelina sativa]